MTDCASWLVCMEHYDQTCSEDSLSHGTSFICYGKCPKILNTKCCDKMAYTNSADPDQSAPEGED